MSWIRNWNFEDNDDTATGKCRWVLSIKNKPKLNSLAFKTRPTASTQLRVLKRARAKTGVGEEATDAADATAFCTTAASTRS